MKAVILAGGKSSRLLPITEHTPKCLLDVGNTTILGNLLSSLTKNGIDDIVVVTGHHAEQIENHIKTNWPLLNVIFINNNNVVGTGPAYGLWLAREYFTEPIIYLNSDLLCEEEVINRILRDESEKSITAIQRIKWNAEAVNVVINSEGKIKDIGKHINEEQSHGEFVGATKLTNDFLKSLRDKLESFVKNGDLKRFAADGINAVIQEDSIILNTVDVTDLLAIEIDTVEDLKQARSMWNNDK